MNKETKIKIGVIGTGHLGVFHIEQLLEINNAKLVGIYDISDAVAKKVSKKYHLKTYNNLKALCKDCDAVSIVTTTSEHYNIANIALDYGCHLFIEKPITETVDQANLLLLKGKNKIIQVGHIENFNPAFCAIKKESLNPQFIESHRLAPFNLRGTDVPVVLDLMIHDIGILLSIVDSKIKHIHGKGVKILSKSCDVANAHIEFENGCIANLTASRISNKQMRKIRFFQEKNYTSIDFLNFKVESYSYDETFLNPSTFNQSLIKNTFRKKIKIYNALKRELNHFIECIINNKKPVFDGSLAKDALKIAIEIQSQIEK
tara:strand:- start:154 stop:1104 length:951 start_codon:yes stop_codon:yes gene_type:complete